LKTPLTSILAYIYLLMAGKLGPLDERQGEALRIMRRNGQQLLSLIQNMLATAQISQGKGRYKLQTTSLATVLHEVHAVFEPIATERRIAFTVDAAEVPVACDGDMVMMALNNLVSNALRFTDEGGSVRVSLREDADTVSVEVADTGIGIPEEFHERIFQRYFQVDGARGGTGLGLEIVKAIVEGHGGRISVSSRPGEGSRFCFVLPKAQTAPGEVVPASAMPEGIR
jgi:two-component system phosphate regulon sensor histidine kinase PhoR